LEALTYTSTYRTNKTRFRLTNLTDMHIGAASCDEALLRKDIGRILADPNHYCILGGDVFDAIPRKDRRFQASDMAEWLRGENAVPQAQLEYGIELLKPLADQGRILAILCGNHETALLRHSEIDLYRGLVHGLKRDDRKIGLGYCGFIRWNIDRNTRKDPESGGCHERWSVNIFAAHGSGGGLLPGGHALTLGRLGGYYDFDLAVLGHRHVMQSLRQTPLYSTPQGQIRDRHRVAAFCGTYYLSFQQRESERMNVNYAEEKGYFPQPVGVYTFVLDPGKRSIRVEEPPHDYPSEKGSEKGSVKNGKRRPKKSAA